MNRPRSSAVTHPGPILDVGSSLARDVGNIEAVSLDTQAGSGH